MQKIWISWLFIVFIALILSCNYSTSVPSTKEDTSIFFIEINPKVNPISMHWQNLNKKIYRSLDSVSMEFSQRGKKMLYACNGGMFIENYFPLGLYIENGMLKNKINVDSGFGNFYLSPNGIFFMDSNNNAGVIKTINFKPQNILYATQSGPMLVFNDTINSHFSRNSNNLNIRNGVGVLPNGNVLFAISKVPINFYDFAIFFKLKQCKNALYLDGHVSQNWYKNKLIVPVKNYNQKFGVIIAVQDSL